MIRNCLKKKVFSLLDSTESDPLKLWRIDAYVHGARPGPARTSYVDTPSPVDPIRRRSMKGPVQCGGLGVDQGGGLGGLSWLTRLCNIAWTSGAVPLDWQTGVVVPIFKSGNQRVCSNYRGITLLSLPGKVYARVLEKRIRLIVEPLIEEEQCGFRPGRGTTDHLFTLAGVLEGSWEFAQPVHMCFVDLEKAYDRVPRSILWGVLRE
ncbi:hypothetical protein D4764_06G0010070 [Takifugu flavidus]|uniref:Reverse transcriptase domain-containing protein n=1 Tax=Takifugu flavidus TaxID=433684 RepID=A0A5C6N1E9_9TELE|nr:hypothetical protein D4764_06G0010070 [Takifugu flavidus]